LGTLDETGISDADKLRVIGLIASYSLSESRMAHDAARAAAQAQSAQSATDAGPVAQWSFEGLLRELVDKESYPRLYQIAWSAEIGDAPSGYDEQQEFEFGLERILDGVQVLIDRTTGKIG
jgi:hypothetical protein